MASIRDRRAEGRGWQVRYRDPDGKQRSRTFKRKSDADRFRTKIEHDLYTASYIDPAAGKVTLETFARDWARFAVVGSGHGLRGGESPENARLPASGRPRAPGDPTLHDPAVDP